MSILARTLQNYMKQQDTFKRKLLETHGPEDTSALIRDYSRTKGNYVLVTSMIFLPFGERQGYISTIAAQPKWQKKSPHAQNYSRRFCGV